MSLDLSPEPAPSVATGEENGREGDALLPPGVSSSKPIAGPPTENKDHTNAPPTRRSPTQTRSPSPSHRRRISSPGRETSPSGRRQYADKDVCRNYLRGNCRRGESCPFLHPIYPEGERPLPPPRKREVCRDFARGDCPRGLRCIFSHEIDGREICRDYARGNCTRLNCQFVHMRNGRPADSGTPMSRPPPPPPSHEEDRRAAYGQRKRPRFEGYEQPPHPPSPMRSISSSELRYLLSLKDEVSVLREENHFLRTELHYLQYDIDRYAPPGPAPSSRPETRPGTRTF